MFLTTRKGQKMNCYKCVSRKVCFLQKQIDSLVRQATDSPFHPKIDTQPDRTIQMFERHEKRMEYKSNMEDGLKKVIASNCSLYQEKTNDTR
jgi:hypothetical protein